MPHDLDEQRFTGLIRLGMERHPDPDRLQTMLRAGAAFTTSPAENERVTIWLEFGTDAAELAAFRAPSWGAPPLPLPDDLSPMKLITAPIRVLEPANQG